MSTNNNDREILSTRLIQALPAQVFKACGDPARLARWWGPNGFTNTIQEFDFKPGGIWRLVMHGPDGIDYPNTFVFEEVSPGRILMRHLEPDHVFTMTITLVEENGATRLTWRQTFATAAECDKIRSYVPRCNEENFDRLEAELARMALEDRELVVTRIIHAPPAAVFNAWTDPELLKKWFTPPPYVTTFAELDIRSGGTNFIIMKGPDGVEMPNRGVYLEVILNKKLVITDAYTKAWEPSGKPFLTILLTFEDAGGKTNYTARILHWTVADRAAHEAMGFRQGWETATDQLAALVSHV